MGDDTKYVIFLRISTGLFHFQITCYYCHNIAPHMPSSSATERRDVMVARSFGIREAPELNVCRMF